MLRIVVFISIGLIALVGCKESHHKEEVTIYEVTDLAQEVKIPKSVMNNLDAELKKDSASVVPTYMFTPLQVQFNESNSDVLKNSSIKFSFPKGGGSLDLKDIVTGFGSFYMSFPAEQFEKMPELVHLYYMSNSPVKKIDGEAFGLGCGKMLDLKKSFSKIQKNDFLKLNTSDLRYLHVLAGRYIFVFKQAAQLYIAQLTISDSRHSKELCLGEDFS